MTNEFKTNEEFKELAQSFIEKISQSDAGKIGAFGVFAVALGYGFKRVLDSMGKGDNNNIITKN